MPEHGGLPALGRAIVRHPVVVIVAWVAVAILLFLTVPPLGLVAQKNPPPFLPEDSPVFIASQKMETAFGEAGSGNVAVVILSNENGLTPADEAVYRTVVDDLKADTANVESVQDFIATPELRQVMSSEDGKAWNLPVSMTGSMGAPSGQEAYRQVATLVKDATANTTLTANLVGAAATFEDINAIGARDQIIIEISTVITVLLILIVVYRNLVAMIIPLLTIGVSLVIAQQIVAALGELGLGLGPQTMVLMTGMMMGAGIDYAVFLFSRYQELVRSGLKSDDALVEALRSIGEVIAGSAGTVALTFLALSFATLGVFSTIGPALAITIAIGFLASITLLPAFIVLAGRRGWIKPRKQELTRQFWRRSGINIVRKPVAHLMASLLLLGGLASCVVFMNYNFDDRQSLPDDAQSNLGYEAMNRHFPISTTLQQFILVHSPDQDLRTPKALADMEQMAGRIAQVPDIDMVRGITRPSGETLEQARATYQAGEVGGKLREASTLINDNDGNLHTLSDGAGQLADVLNEIRNGVVGALGSVRGLAGALDDMSTRFGGTKTLEEIDKTASLVGNMRSLGDALSENVTRVKDLYAWATPVVNGLNTSLTCNLDAACVKARAELQRLAAARDDIALDRMAELARQLQTTDGTDSVSEALRGIGENLTAATQAARDLGIAEPGGVQKQLDTMLEGANTLADSSRQLAEGVQLLVDQTRQLGGGLNQASSFLLAMRTDAAEPPMSGFYIPPEVLTQQEFEKAAKLFVSEDGRTVRYLVQTALNPFGRDAMDQVSDIIAAAESARPNTALANAEISMVGFSAVNADVRQYYSADSRFIMISTLVVVFVILALLLRAIVAPLYLVATVILSYGSALGIGVILFQFILGEELHWSVPGLAFLVLVAVGADYNLLLISRIRDEAGKGVRTGVIRTVGATGGVITSAGLIFAASMLALTVSSISTIVQMGFVIGVGLLLDTFVVRTVTVPAACVLIGDANWWPSKGPRAVRKARAVRPPEQPVRRDDNDDDDWADCDFTTAIQAAGRVSHAWDRS
ncbi:RND family transporter [Mycobacterium sp. 236(2023)]|uniref:MMPL/RND family transporter n=1 Tax=Mycobacterium sp. 236(2023) TaxID=3038163 RepID=UPI00241526C6|nr:RND family transporter [Mycobacterium sp. 236(2023)]MDG4668997.1 RND family transporter [Mycobacterium sp. 236(2023)]